MKDISRNLLKQQPSKAIEYTINQISKPYNYRASPKTVIEKLQNHNKNLRPNQIMTLYQQLYESSCKHNHKFYGNSIKNLSVQGKTKNNDENKRNPRTASVIESQLKLENQLLTFLQQNIMPTSRFFENITQKKSANEHHFGSSHQSKVDLLRFHYIRLLTAFEYDLPYDNILKLFREEFLDSVDDLNKDVIDFAQILGYLGIVLQTQQKEFQGSQKSKAKHRELIDIILEDIEAQLDANNLSTDEQLYLRSTIAKGIRSISRSSLDAIFHQSHSSNREPHENFPTLYRLFTIQAKLDVKILHKLNQTFELSFQEVWPMATDLTDTTAINLLRILHRQQQQTKTQLQTHKLNRKSFLCFFAEHIYDPVIKYILYRYLLKENYHTVSKDKSINLSLPGRRILHNQTDRQKALQTVTNLGLFENVNMNECIFHPNCFENIQLDSENSTNRQDKQNQTPSVTFYSHLNKKLSDHNFLKDYVTYYHSFLHNSVFESYSNRHQNTSLNLEKIAYRVISVVSKTLNPMYKVKSNLLNSSRTDLEKLISMLMMSLYIVQNKSHQAQISQIWSQKLKVVSLIQEKKYADIGSIFAKSEQLFDGTPNQNPQSSEIPLDNSLWTDIEATLKLTDEQIHQISSSFTESKQRKLHKQISGSEEHFSTSPTHSKHELKELIGEGLLYLNLLQFSLHQIEKDIQKGNQSRAQQQVAKEKLINIVSILLQKWSINLNQQYSMEHIQFLKSIRQFKKGQ